MEVRVVNGGPEAVTVAQLMVDDANWVHQLDGARTIDAARVDGPISIPYPWVEGEPHTVTLVTSTGLTFSRRGPGRHPVAADRRHATSAPSRCSASMPASSRSSSGCSGCPSCGAIDRRVDRVLPQPHDRPAGLPRRGRAGGGDRDRRLVAGAFQGTSLVLLGVAVHARWRIGRARASGGRAGGDALTALCGGTHRAAGSDCTTWAKGSPSAPHTPPARSRSAPSWWSASCCTTPPKVSASSHPSRTSGPASRSCSCSGALAGVPTVLGAWIGAFTYSPVLTTVFFAVGAGAIAQVVYELWRLFARRRRCRPRGAAQRRRARSRAWSSCMRPACWCRREGGSSPADRRGAPALRHASLCAGAASHRRQQLPDRGGVQPGGRGGAAHQHLRPRRRAATPGPTPSPRSGRSAGSAIS